MTQVETDNMEIIDSVLVNDHELLRNVMKITTNAIFVIDLQGKFIFLNIAGSTITGYSVNELKGAAFSVLFTNDAIKSINDQLKKTAVHGITVSQYEAEIVHKDGGKRFITYSLVPLINNGKITCILVVAEDITKRKHAEIQIQLEELVNKRTEQLKTVQEKLIHTAKLSAIGKLSASIAHEFNNPICGIRNVLERINKRISEGVNLDKTHKDLTALAIKECNRIADLLRKLQDFHRPSSGIVSKTNIHDAIDEMVLISKKKLKERNIELTKHYSRDIPQVDAVGDQIRQVVLNFIQNAEEAIPEKGGNITITTKMDDSNVKIHISDTGCGIPPQNMITIFEPFFTTKPAVKGTGLGLCISYGIIKQHGGNIEVKSSLTNGTTFTIILPITGNR